MVVPDEDYRRQHPTIAVLVVEVARSSLATDLEAKPQIYAAAGVAEYWVVDLDARVVHVHRGRRDDGYAEVSLHAAGALVSGTEPPFTLDLEAVLPPDQRP